VGNSQVSELKRAGHSTQLPIHREDEVVVRVLLNHGGVVTVVVLDEPAAAPVPSMKMSSPTRALVKVPLADEKASREEEMIPSAA